MTCGSGTSHHVRVYDDRLAPPAVPSRLRRIATALTAQLDEQTERLSAAMVEGIPGLPHDEQMRRLLVRSVRANLRTAAAVYAGSCA